MYRLITFGVVALGVVSSILTIQPVFMNWVEESRVKPDSSISEDIFFLEKEREITQFTRMGFRRTDLPNGYSEAALNIYTDTLHFSGLDSETVEIDERDFLRVLKRKRGKDFYGRSVNVLSVSPGDKIAFVSYIHNGGIEGGGQDFHAKGVKYCINGFKPFLNEFRSDFFKERVFSATIKGDNIDPKSVSDSIIILSDNDESIGLVFDNSVMDDSDMDIHGSNYEDFNGFNDKQIENVFGDCQTISNIKNIPFSGIFNSNEPDARFIYTYFTVI